jgi:DNA-binding transcriptional LysR family regulator
MHLRGIDTNQVLALHALLTHRSVTRAAKDLGLSQSSTSHALARLRAHFGDPLLVPAGRALVLTERARGLAEPVAEAVVRLERVFARPEPFDPRTSRRVFRVAATDNVELYVLPSLAAILERSAPGVDVRVCALPEDWAAALQRGDVDLKLGRRYPVPAALESEVLSQETLACVVRRGHPAPTKPSLQAYAALRHLLVAPTATGSTPIDAVLEKHGLRRRIAMTVPHFLVAPFIVASSDLALTAPARLLDPFARRLRLRRVELPLRPPGYQISQVWAARSRDDEAHAWLRSTIARAFARAPSPHGGPR